MHALVLTLLLPVGSMAIAMLVVPHLPAPERHPYDGSAGAFALQAVRLVLGVGLFCAIGLLWIGRLGWRDLGWRDLGWRQVALGVAGFVVTAAAFGGFLVAATDFTPATLLEAVAGLTWRERLLGVVIGISASIVEESLIWMIIGAL